MKTHMINIGRPLPLQPNADKSVIEIIKELKSLAINDKSYNTYFDKYYNISENECNKSNITKILKNESLNNPKKNNISNILPLQDNDIYMEVMFSKNFQSRMDKLQLQTSKISKNNNLLSFFNSKNNFQNDTTIPFKKRSKLKPLELPYKEMSYWK